MKPLSSRLTVDEVRAACVNGASPLIDGCDFTGNYTNNYGSAVYCSNGSDPHILACNVDAPLTLLKTILR